MADYFYESHQWSRIRYVALKRDGFKCLACGSDRSGGAILHVDHIKPRSKYPELELDLENLQTLCASCNIGKWNDHEDSFREPVKLLVETTMRRKALQNLNEDPTLLERLKLLRQQADAVAAEPHCEAEGCLNFGAKLKPRTTTAGVAIVLCDACAADMRPNMKRRTLFSERKSHEV